VPDLSRRLWRATVYRIGTALTAALAVALAVTFLGPVGVASAEPGDEGGNPTLGQILETVNRQFLDAQAALADSSRRQHELGLRLTVLEANLARRTAEAAPIAVEAYQNRTLATASALLDSGSPAALMDRVTAINTLARRTDKQLRELSDAKREVAAAKAAIDAEVVRQQQQTAELAKKRQEAERALASVGGRATGGFVSPNSPLAQPAPRRPDGSWAPESCIIDDPTTSGCLTPRTLHSLRQAQAAGFTRFVGCYRPGGPYEHPKGRACDFAAQAGGFGGVATGGDRLYGNNLAAFFVRNGDRLGVLYVIWYRQIWTPATGWRAYQSGNGDPSSDHTNHVHLSVY